MGKGEFRVGSGFNPSGKALVDQIKRMSADLIDLIDEVSITPEGGKLAGERQRLKSLAQTAIEEGAMWAVKAVTKR